MKISLILSLALALVLLPSGVQGACKAGCEICFVEDQLCYQCTDTTKTPESDCACDYGQYLDGANGCKPCLDTCKSCQYANTCQVCIEQDGVGLFADGTCDCVPGFKRTGQAEPYCQQLYLYGDAYVEVCPEGSNANERVHICEVPKREDILPGDRIAILVCTLLIIIVMIILSLLLYLYLVKKMIEQFKDKKNNQKIHSEEELGYLLNQQERERQRMRMEDEERNKLKDDEVAKRKRKLMEEEEARRAQMEQEMEERKKELEKQRLLRNEKIMEEDAKIADEVSRRQFQEDRERVRELDEEVRLRAWENNNGPVDGEFGRVRVYDEHRRRLRKIEEIRVRDWERRNKRLITSGINGALPEYLEDEQEENLKKKRKFMEDWEVKHGPLDEDNEEQYKEFCKAEEEERLREEEILLKQWEKDTRGDPQEEEKRLRKFEEDMEEARKLQLEGELKDWEKDNGRLADRFDRQCKLQERRMRTWEKLNGNVKDQNQLRRFLNDQENERQIEDQKFKDEFERANGKIDGDRRRARTFQQELRRRRRKIDDDLLKQIDLDSQGMGADEKRLKEYEQDVRQARDKMNERERVIRDIRLRQWEGMHGPITKPEQGQLDKFEKDLEDQDQEKEDKFREEWEKDNGQVESSEENMRKFQNDWENARKIADDVLVGQWEAENRTPSEQQERLRRYEEDMERARRMGGDRERKIRDIRLRLWEQKNGGILEGDQGQLRPYLRDQEQEEQEEEIRFRSGFERQHGRIMGNKLRGMYRKALREFLEGERQKLLEKWEAFSQENPEQRLEKYTKDWDEAVRRSRCFYRDDRAGILGRYHENGERRRRAYRDELEAKRNAFQRRAEMLKRRKQRLLDNEERRIQKMKADLERARQMKEDLLAKQMAEDEARRLAELEAERARIAAEEAERLRQEEERRKAEAKRKSERRLARQATTAQNDAKMKSMRDERERLRKEKAVIEGERNEIMGDFDNLGAQHNKMRDENEEREKRKQEVIQLRADILRKQQEIKDRQRELDKQMEGVDYEGTRNKVRELSQEDLVFLQNLRTPPARVVLCLEAVCAILYGNTKKVDWKEIKGVISSLSFRKDILRYDPDIMKPKVQAFIQKQYIGSPEWNVGKMYKASKACGVIAEWIDALMKFKEMMSTNKDLFEQVQEMKKVVNSMDDDQDRLDELERQEKEYQQQIDEAKGKMASNMDRQKTLMKSATIKDGDIKAKQAQIDALKTGNLTLAEVSDESDDDEENQEILNNL